MPITQTQNTKTITLALTPADEERIVTVYQSPRIVIGSEIIAGHRLISFNCFIKNLKAYGHIPSLPQTPLPDFQPEDSDAVRRKKALDIEWAYPRKQLNVFISSGLAQDNAPWHQVGSVSLLNPYGYPYRIYTLMDLFTDNLALELGTNTRIGVQVQDVNWGYLDEIDRLTIHGSYSEEQFLSYENPVANVYISGGTGSSSNTPPPTPGDGSIGNDSDIGNDTNIGN